MLGFVGWLVGWLFVDTCAVVVSMFCMVVGYSLVLLQVFLCTVDAYSSFSFGRFGVILS